MYARVCFIQRSSQSVGPPCSLPLADLFIPITTRLLSEAFSHVVVNARRLFPHLSTVVYSQILIYRTECTGTLLRERKCTSLETAANGIEESVRHSTAYIPRST